MIPLYTVDEGEANIDKNRRGRSYKKIKLVGFLVHRKSPPTNCNIQSVLGSINIYEGWLTTGTTKKGAVALTLWAIVVWHLPIAI